MYRAANSLLRLAVDGRLSLCFHPPGYSGQRGEALLMGDAKRVGGPQDQTALKRVIDLHVCVPGMEDSSADRCSSKGVPAST